MENLKVTIETIDVETAKKYLELNTSNRNLSQSVVNSYADTIKKGGWYLNGEAIKFDNTGKLTDGQHRLHAVVKAGVPIQSLVIRDVKEEAFASYDCGRSRTAGQLMGMRGVKNYNTVSSIVKTRFMLNGGLRTFRNEEGASNIKKEKITNDEIMKLFEKDALKYEQYGQKAVSIRNRIGKLNIVPAFIAAVWMHLVEDLGYPQSFVDYFFENATSDESCENPLVNNVRKMLCFNTGNSIETMEYKVNRLFKAWNKYARGECNGTLLKWDKHREGVISLLPYFKQ